jgi:hypothetical protein
MHLSKYCKKYPSGEDTESVILFSTQNAAIVEIPESIAGDLPNALFTQKDRNTLRKLGFLVADSEKERRELLAYIDELNKLNQSLNIKLVSRII